MKLVSCFLLAMVGLTTGAVSAQDGPGEDEEDMCLECFDINSQNCIGSTTSAMSACHHHIGSGPSVPESDGDAPPYSRYLAIGGRHLPNSPNPNYYIQGCPIHFMCGAGGDGGDPFQNEEEKVLSDIDAAAWELGASFDDIVGLLDEADWADYSMRRIPVGIEIARWCERGETEVTFIVPVPS